MCFIQNPLRSHSAGHRSERFNQLKEDCLQDTWKHNTDADHPTVDPKLGRQAWRQLWGPKLGTTFEAPMSRVTRLPWEFSEEDTWDSQTVEGDREEPRKAAALPAEEGPLMSGHDEWKQTGHYLTPCFHRELPVCARLHHSPCWGRFCSNGQAWRETCCEQWGLDGPCASDSAWSNCGRDVPHLCKRCSEGAARGPRPGRRQPFNATPSFSAPSQQALLCVAPFGLHKWEREDVASSQRFLPTSLVALEANLEGRGAEKLIPSRDVFGQCPFQWGASRSRALFRRNSCIIPFGCTWGLGFFQEGPPAEWEERQALGRCLNPPAPLPRLPSIQRVVKGLKISSIALQH